MHFKADLHNHSCLSPCGSLYMSPAVLAGKAAEQSIDLLALTDHNSARNLPAFAACCSKTRITPIFGIEVNTLEEVHVVCLFEHLDQALSFGSYIESLLPEVKNRPKIFGDQVIVDAEENITGYIDTLLFSSITKSYEELVKEVLQLDGLVIPAHIDRFGNGVISQLGFLPELPYSAVESITYPSSCDTYAYTVITGSDAHHPSQIGQRSFTITDCEQPNFRELASALRDNRVICRNS